MELSLQQETERHRPRRFKSASFGWALFSALSLGVTISDSLAQDSKQHFRAEQAKLAAEAQKPQQPASPPPPPPPPEQSQPAANTPASDAENIRKTCLSGPKLRLSQAVINEACAKLSQVTTLNAETRISAYNTHGLAFYNKGKYQEAINVFEEGLKLNENAKSLMLNKALSLIALKQCPEAFTLYEKAFKLYPEVVAAQFGMARALSCQGKSEEALKLFDEVVIAAPHIDTYYIHRMHEAARLGDAKKAGEGYEALDRLIPKFRFYIVQAALFYYIADDMEMTKAALATSDKRQSDYTYATLLRHLIGVKEKAAENKLAAKTYESFGETNTIWPGPLFGYFAGAVSDQDAFKLAHSDNADTQAFQLADYYFYSAELLLLQGQRDEAIKRYKLCIEQKQDGIPEHWASVTRLAMLNKPAVASTAGH